MPIPESRGFLRHTLWKRIEEPLGFNTTEQPDLGQRPIAAIFGIKRHQKQKWRLAADNLSRCSIRQHYLRARFALRNAIRESQQDRLKQCIVVVVGLLQRADESQQMVQVLPGRIANGFVECFQQVVVVQAFA